ncbi:MAG: zinc ABC transporter substrate-binding protein [Spirochaetaceae bacterium]|nr:zinc ABC transporter substrate-binding protein [Spirochaetaceae bacterium]
MKKTISLFIMILITVSIFAGGAKEQGANSSGTPKIVTTIFPEYDWVNNILGQNPADVELTMLLNSGADLHSYQPTVADIMKISICDLFIYVGGESDKWVDDALKEAVNKNMVVINLLETLGDKVKEEEIVEGMQGEDEEEEAEYDEHVWLSLKNAAILCDAIADEVCKIDSPNAATYKANAAAYISKLNALDAKYTEAVANSTVKTVLFGDRFPFRYLVDDYGLSYYAAFVGCSAETEASFETIAFLSKKVDELSLGTILTIDGNNHKIAQTIALNTKAKNQKILILDSMQSVTSKDVKNGANYLSIMEKNLETLKTALGASK